MNLSSYLQMPPAPNVPSSSPSLTPPGARVGASPSMGGNLGFDFAQVMARQIQRLVPQERQTLAGEAPQAPEVQARDSENARYPDDRHNTERASQKTPAETRSRQSEAAENTEEDHKERPETETHTRPRAKALPQKTTPIDEASLSNGWVPATPVTPVTPVTPTQNDEASSPEVAAASPANATPLQTIELSPQVRIITDPKKAPSPESLAAFAKSMGLDESTIHNLLGQSPNQAVVGTAVASATSAQTDVTAGLTPPANPIVTPSGLATAASTLPTTQSDALNALAQAAIASNSVMPPAMGVSGAGLALSASTLNAPTLPGLSPTDMAAIQQVQITVLPAAVLPMNVSHSTPTPSTLDMLSLLGSGVDEQDVNALLTRFTEEAGTGNQDSPSEQHASNGESNNFSSFSQTLARNNNAAAANANAAQAAGPDMSEVYDQLSDKMATEMAARMHKQLSDGEWKMKFGLRPANLGGVEIHLEMKDGKLDAVFHADNPLTRDLLQNSSQRLREALGNFGINAGQVQVGQGGSNAQQNASGNSGKRPQVRDNSSSQVNGSEHAPSVSATRNKANASLLDLYA
jgi:flagellar hook-length control protein FliK